MRIQPAVLDRRSAASVPLAAAVVLALLGFAPAASAQLRVTTGPDTTAIAALDDSVSTPDRATTNLAESAYAATNVRSRGVFGRPATHLTDLLVGVPGFTILDRDGFGHDPQLVVRGFARGGGRDQVVMLRDGLPLNDWATGRVAWDLFPGVVLDGAEVALGPASAAYGDGATAGVVNLRTAPDAPQSGAWELSASQPIAVQAAARFEGELMTLPVVAYGGFRRVNGYREHASRTVFNGGGTLPLTRGDGRDLSLSVYGAWSDADRPGPLTASDVASGRDESDLFYSYDGVAAWVARADLDGSLDISDGTLLSGGVAAELRRSNEILTVQTTLDAARTDEQTVDTDRIFATAHLEQRGLGLPWSDHLVVGFDASTGGLSRELRDVVSGGRVTYVFFEPTRPLVASGDGSRTTLGGFARYEVRPIDALRISLGGRLDRISDSYEPGDPAPGPNVSTKHTAFSPRAAANLRWLDAPGQTGHLFASVGRTFNAPTPSQLFDPRAVPVVPGVEEPISNPLLEPERGASVEVGARHGMVIVPGAWRGSATVTAYRIEMEDEIVLDVSTFLYENVGESRHEGIELGIDVEGPSRSELSVSYAVQDVTSRAGANAGNTLKTVPGHTLVGEASRGVTSTVDVGVRVTRHGTAWLDDANTVRLPAFTRVDVGASVVVMGAQLFADVSNVLDESYSTTGFLAPGAGDIPLYFPAAGRVLQLGLRIGG